MKLTRDHGLLIARIAMAIVFIWFGIGKFQDDIWAETMRQHPMMHRVPVPIDTQIYLAGVTEIAIGVFLLAGVYIRAAAVIGALELVFIFFFMGIYEVRDLGLIGALVMLAIEGTGIYGVQMLRKHNPQ